LKFGQLTAETLDECTRIGLVTIRDLNARINRVEIGQKIANMAENLSTLICKVKVLIERTCLQHKKKGGKFAKVFSVANT
jgi:hypothetical protein